MNLRIEINGREIDPTRLKEDVQRVFYERQVAGIRSLMRQPCRSGDRVESDHRVWRDAREHEDTGYRLGRTSPGNPESAFWQRSMIIQVLRLGTRTPVSSTALRVVSYDGHTLTVEFHSGRVYDHPGVPFAVYIGLMQASSKGAYYNRYIRGRYR